MKHEDIHERYKKLFRKLQEIILVSKDRVICEEIDTLFIENINFFTKSYLISLCTYLEACLQDIAYVHAMEIGQRTKNARIPRNYLLWSLDKEIKKKELAFEDIDIKPDKKEISNDLSGNPHKTIMLFRYLGIDLTNDERFNKNKDLVGTVVSKRNNIIHHNDEAMDISFDDLLNFIDVFMEYMEAIVEQACLCRVSA
jgi:hypothetical protein